MKKRSSTNTSKPLDYQALKSELTEVMDKLEQGDLDVDAAVAYYERGLAIIKTLEAQLQDAENRISELNAASVGPDLDEEE